MWPFKSEKRQAVGGGYTEAVSTLIYAQAVGTAQNASTTAALESVAGMLSRTFASAEVTGRARDCPGCLATRAWARLAAIWFALEKVVARHPVHGRPPDVDTGFNVVLGPAAPTQRRGPCDRDGVRAKRIVNVASTARQSVVYMLPGDRPTARPYHGLGPDGLGSGNRAVERERRTRPGRRSRRARRPIAARSARWRRRRRATTDPLAPLKSDIAARRRAMPCWWKPRRGVGARAGPSAPQSDWRQSRLGPLPPDAMVKLAESAFARVLAACGASPALFDDSDGTSKREAYRQWTLNVVRPFSRILSVEMSEKFGSPVALKFDDYGRDMVSRAQVFSKLIAAEGMSKEMALAISGLMETADAA